MTTKDRLLILALALLTPPYLINGNAGDLVIVIIGRFREKEHPEGV
jgi:hypothetical protein